jgi:DNA-binding transcriptional ArsR family regulator
MIELLSTQDLTAGNIAARFEQSRPAVSRHLRLLREAGVVEVRTEGTRRIYTLRRDPLADAERWLRQRLEALDTELRRARRG